MAFRDKYKFPLNTKWDSTQIDFINPTPNPVTADIFNTITVSNFPSSPSGTVYPSAVGSSIIIGAGLSRASALSTVNQFVYVASITSASVFVFDTTTNTFVTTIVVPSSIIGQMVYCSSTNRIYGGATGSVHVIDCATNTYLLSVPAPSPAVDVVGLDYSFSFNSVFCTQPSIDTVFKINCSTNTIVGTVVVVGTAPTAVVYNTSNGFVYAFPTGVTTSVIKISPSTFVLSSTIPIASVANVFGTSVYVSSNNSVYYQEGGTFLIKQFDCDSETINPTSIGIAGNSIGMIYVQSTNLIYVSDNFTPTDYIRIINPNTNTIFQSISTPIVDYGDYASLVYNSAKNSVYESSSPIGGAVGIFEISSTANFYMSSPYNYNALLQDVQQNPMLIRRIDMICGNQSQFTQPLNIVTRDANGIFITTPKLPNTNLSVNQAQPNLVTIDFEGKELILDDNTVFSQYTFPANSSTRIVVYYKQVKRLDIVTKGLSLLQEVEKNLWLEQTSITEAELNETSNYPMILEREAIKQKRLAEKIKYMDKLKTLLIK